MKKTIILYGCLLAALTGLLKFIEYRFWVRDLSVEIYISVIAIFFTVLGVWVGLKLTKGKPVSDNGNQNNSNRIDLEFDLNSILEEYSISKREHEVLTLIAKGLSNKEIADSLFLSTNTVKTHSSNLFAKLDVKRRTQAVQKAMEIGLLNDELLSA